MNNNPKFGFIVEYVTDIAAARRFYSEVLQLKVERDHPTFVQFEHFALASDESLGGSRDREIFWLVEDAEAAFADFSRKAEVIRTIQQMPFGKVFGIKDPAGQPLYFCEFAQQRPSQPV